MRRAQGGERQGWVQEILLRRANFLSKGREEPGRGKNLDFPCRHDWEKKKNLHFKYTVPSSHPDFLEIHVSKFQFLEVVEVIVRH